MKILLIYDSLGLARSFPPSDKTDLEDTYPMRIEREFSNHMVKHICFGNITTGELCSHAISYFSSWNPEIIVIASGINDARPEGISEHYKKYIRAIFKPLAILEKLFPFMRGSIKKIVNIFESPILIKIINGYRTSEKQFEITLKRMIFNFDKSKIYYVEIVCDKKYESKRPGVTNRVLNYNKIINLVFKNNMIRINEKMINHGGFHEDNFHLNKTGHKIFFKEIVKKISPKND